MTCSFHASVTTVIIAVACLGALWLSGTAHATVLEDAVERGIVLLNNGDIDAARTTLAAAGEGEETSPTLLAARGLVEAFAGSATTANSVAIPMPCPIRGNPDAGRAGIGGGPFQPCSCSINSSNFPVG